jgi:hypothetical protein
MSEEPEAGGGFISYWEKPNSRAFEVAETTQDATTARNEISSDYLADNESPRDGWYQSLEDPAMVRYYHEWGQRWGLETTVEFALLNEFQSVKKSMLKQKMQIDSIKFRVGFIAMIGLLAVVGSILFFLNSLGTSL